MNNLLRTLILRDSHHICSTCERVPLMHNILKTYKAFTRHIRRMRINFRSKSRGFNDIKLPPEPTNCCMSGCPNCVWIEYAETLSKVFADGGEKAREVILEKVTDPNMKAFLSTELRIIEMKKNSTDRTEKP